MIHMQKNKNGDIYAEGFASVPKEVLLKDSTTHIDDVSKGLAFFKKMLFEASTRHDIDKLTDIDEFHKDFVSDFKRKKWWENHKRESRHHLMTKGGVPEDVNLIDVLEFITDCIMAGMRRKGKVYPVTITEEVLKQAFDNTVKLLQDQVVLEDTEEEEVI